MFKEMKMERRYETKFSVLHLNRNEIDNIIKNINYTKIGNNMTVHQRKKGYQGTG